MKPFIVFSILCASFYSKSQDTLFLKNNGIIPSLVLQINTNDIVYKKMSNLDGPDYKTNKSEVKYIKYKNGQIENIDSLYAIESNKTIANNIPSSTSNVYEKSEQMYINGKRDAKIFYDSPTGAVGTGITSFILLPFGLIPAIICSAVPPREKNLDYPNYDLWKNENYKAGYKHQAKKMKQKKVWAGFGIGLGAGILLRAFINNT
jgi:hypothetical protein